MKKTTVILASVLLSVFILSGFIQQQKTEQYAIVILRQGLQSDKYTIEVNMGLKGSAWKDNTVKDPDGKIRVFNEEVDVLEYMAGDGWNYVDSNVSQVKGQNVIRYIFRR